VLVQTHFPHKLSSKRYDQFLASGWFRGSVMLYKMDVLCMEDCLFSVVNIRLNIREHESSKSLRKLLSKNLKKFRVEIGNVSLNKESEQLYDKHKIKFKGFVHRTLRDYLYSGLPNTVFNTQEIKVYDGGKLIACSYFDVGEKSIASLLGLYDFDYSSHSLGMFTMLLELDYAKKIAAKWYYPGYILHESDQFNYKLRLGNFQYYNENKRWVKFNGVVDKKSSANKLLDKIRQLENELLKLGVDFKRRIYPYFGIGYLEMWDVSFLRAPLVLELNSNSQKGMLLLTYDMDEQIYSFDICNQAFGYEHLVQNNLKHNPNDEFSIPHLVRIQFPIFQGKNPKQVSKIVLDTITNNEV